MRFWYKLYTHCLSIFGFFTILRYRYLTLDDVHFYQEYIGHVLKRRMSRRNTLGKVIEDQTTWGDFLKDVEGGLIVDADT